jgi:hypothetical protein
MDTQVSLTHPIYTAKIGLPHMYGLTAASSVAWSTLSWYLVWQRTRHVGAAVRVYEAGRDLPRGIGEETRAASIGEGDGDGVTESSSSGSTVASPAVAAEDESTTGRDGSAISRPGRAAPAAGPAAEGMRELVPQQAGGPPSALLRLLPSRLGTDLVYIKSEDHYLEVHTTVGSSLIKMRFSGAVAQLGDRGIQVHRSYWVATGHVTRSVRSGKRTLLRITGRPQGTGERDPPACRPCRPAPLTIALQPRSADDTLEDQGATRHPQ